MSIWLALMCPGMPWASQSIDTQDAHLAANQWRAHYGLHRYDLDEHCCALAAQHARWMADRDWLVHGTQDQIIAVGPRNGHNAIAIWAGSPPHFGWLLSNHRRAGYAHAVSRSGRHYWVGVFR